MPNQVHALIQTPEPKLTGGMQHWLSGYAIAQRHESTIRRVHAVTVTEVLEAIASHHGVDRLKYAFFRSAAPGRDKAAWLCRRWTGVALWESGLTFGLNGTDSISNPISRSQQQSKRSASWRKRASESEATST